MRSIESNARAGGLRVAVEHLAPAARLDDDDRDRVRDDVVQLARDPLPLLGHGRAGPLVLVALELDGAEGERAFPLAAQAHHHAGEPGAAEDQRPEDDVAPVERVAVVGDEGGDRERDQHDRGPGLAPAGVRAEGVEREDEDDDEDHGLVVELRRQR